MIKAKFGDVTYYDPENDNPAFAEPFDAAHFDELIANRQYLQAADYAAKYHFDNPEKDRNYQNEIINLRRKGRQLEAIYSKVGNDEDLKAITFVDNVFIDGGTNNKDTGFYGEQFKQWKQQIGSPDGNATNLSITFFPKKQTLLGIDFLMPDNKNTIENFYENSGLSEEDLTAAGINVIHKDGKTILKFNKTNGLANKILYHLPQEGRRGDLGISNFDVRPKIEGVNEAGEVVGIEQGRNLKYFKQTIDDANKIKNKYLGDLQNSQKQYSSTSTPWISDELYRLEQMGLTPDEYNKQAKIIAPKIFDALYGFSSARYEMYSDAYNPDDRDETLRPMDNQERADLADLIASTQPNGMKVGAMVSNGKIGVVVTILGKTKDGTDEITSKPKRIFIPNLLLEEAQKRINLDSSYRAVQEINSMLDLRYNYKLQDGRELKLNENGDFAVTEAITDAYGQYYEQDRVISREEAIRTLDKDILLEDAKANLKYRYTNSKGDVFDTDGYEQKAREITLQAVNELYPDMSVRPVPIKDGEYGMVIVDQYGNQYDAIDLFNDNIPEDTTQFEVYERLRNIYDVYNQLMKDLMKHLSK